MVTKSCIL